MQELSPEAIQGEDQRNTHRGIFIILGIIAFFGVGLGGVLLGKYLFEPKVPSVAPSVTPTPQAEAIMVTPSLDVTSDWETYTNLDYGYSIKYPVAIEVSSTIKKSKGEGYIFFSLPEQAHITPTLSITHVQNNKRLSAKNFYTAMEEQGKKEHAEQGWPPLMPTIEMKDLDINGEKAFQFKFFDGDKDSIYTYFAKEDFIVAVGFPDYPIENDPNNAEHLNLFDQILSTFRFTD